MKATSKFRDPQRRPTKFIRWISTAAVGLWGVIVLYQSYGLTGMAMEWRISAGVSAISFSLISLLMSANYPHGTRGLIRRWGIAYAIAIPGTLFLYLASRQGSDWAKAILLESGVACLFVAAVELMLGAIRASAVEKEREESAFYDELALDVGYAWDLTLFQYRAMRDGLDHVVAEGQGRRFSDRVALLLQFAKKAKDLPEELYFTRNPEFKAHIERELAIAELACAATEKYSLTDNEHLYLASVITTRADPSRPRGEPIDARRLPQIVENSADAIVKGRRRGIKRLAFWQNWDPLSAMEELNERARRVPARPFGAFGTDETASAEDEGE